MNATILTPSQQNLFDYFRRLFRDLSYFDRLAAEPVRRSIVDLESGTIVLNSTIAKTYPKSYTTPARKMCKADKELDLSVSVNHIMCTLCVFMTRRSRNLGDIYSPEKVEELNEILDGLEDFDNVECHMLLTYRDVVETAVELFPGQMNKARVMFIGHRLGGSNLSMGKYSTGGGQSKCTSRRVRLYEFVSGVLQVPRSEVAVELVPPMPPADTPEPAPTAAARVVTPTAFDSQPLTPPVEPLAPSTNAVITPTKPRAAKKRPRQAQELLPPPAEAPEDVHQQYQVLLRMLAEHNANVREGRCVDQKTTPQSVVLKTEHAPGSAGIYKICTPSLRIFKQPSSAPLLEPTPSPFISTKPETLQIDFDFSPRLFSDPYASCTTGEWRGVVDRYEELPLLQQISTLSDSEPPGVIHEERYDDNPNYGPEEGEEAHGGWVHSETVGELPFDGMSMSLSGASWNARSVPTLPSLASVFKHYKAGRALVDRDAADTLISISGF